MTIKEKIDTKKYYLIDKIIINEDKVFNFDIYGKKEKEDSLSLIHKRGFKLTDTLVNNIITQQSLYVYENDKDSYDKYYNIFINKKAVPQNIEATYQEVGKTVNNIFENPESVKNIKIAEDIVSDTVSTILKDNFTVSSVISILAYDYRTNTHSLNVSIYSLCLGKHMGMEKQTLEDLGVAALLHDLGKSRIDPKILNKNGVLTREEFKEVKKHPVYGWGLAKRLGIRNKHILAGIRNHHERIDGKGYPDGLRNNDIHIYAKIIAICDVFDALTTKREYKNPVSTFNTLIMMKKEMSNHLDGTIVDHFISMFKEENNL